MPSGTSVKGQRPRHEYLGRSLGKSESLLVTPNMFPSSLRPEGLFSSVQNEDPYPDYLAGPSALPSHQSHNVFPDAFSYFDSGEEEKNAKTKAKRESNKDVLGIVCYAKNSEGYSIQPCRFSLQIVGKIIHRILPMQ